MSDSKSQKNSVDLSKSSELRVILNHVADGITVQDPTGNLIFANNTAAHILGYSSARELVQTPPAEIMQRFEIMDEDGNPFPLTKLPGRLALAGLKSPKEVIQFRTKKTKRTYWSLVGATPIFDKNKKVRFAINVFHDITALKKTEEQLNISESRFRALIEKSFDAITLTDKKGKTIYASNSIKDILGYEPQKFVGKIHGIKLLHPADMDNIMKIFGGINKKPRATARGQLRALHADGTYRWIEATATNFFDDPAVDALVTNFRDITAQKAIEENLKKSEERFRAIFTHATIAMSISDFSGNWIAINEAYLKLFGYTRAELREKKTFANITHPDDITADREAIKKLKRGEMKRYDKEKRYIHKNGSILWTVVHVSTIPNNEGKPSHIVKAIEDITERKLLESQKDEFIAIASHELKTPITSLKIYAQALEKLFAAAQDTKAVASLAKMNQQIDKLTYLINDLLDISRIQGRKFQLHPQWFDLESFLTELRDDMQMATKTHKIIISGQTK